MRVPVYVSSQEEAKPYFDMLQFSPCATCRRVHYAWDFIHGSGKFYLVCRSDWYSQTFKQIKDCAENGFSEYEEK